MFHVHCTGCTVIFHVQVFYNVSCRRCTVLFHIQGVIKFLMYRVFYNFSCTVISYVQNKMRKKCDNESGRVIFL